MTERTGLEMINDPEMQFDCGPRHEAIVGGKFITDIWVYSNCEHIIFHAASMKQFTGATHLSDVAAMICDATDDPDGPNAGWLEDGTAQKGETINEAAFDTITEALEWLNEETKRLLVQEYGSLEAEKLAV